MEADAKALTKDQLKTAIAWSFYDWASAGFASVIETFLFASYFVRHVAKDETGGMAAWGFTIGIVGFAIALLGPFLGAVADATGDRRPFLIGCTWACIAVTISLWGIEPDVSYQQAALILVGMGIFFSEAASIFYNSLLVDIVPENHIGRWSGWAWGFGYFGAMSCLILSLGGCMDCGSEDNFFYLRLMFPLVGLWYFIFSLPLFWYMPRSKKKEKPWQEILRDSFSQVTEFCFKIREHRNFFCFFLAKMLYSDGLVTLFTFGGIVAASLFNMEEKEVLVFGIALNISAGIGSLMLAPFDDRLGSKKMIMGSLAALIVVGFFLFFAETKAWFWFFGILLGFFVGPVQASSRSYLSRLTPEHMRTQVFGFNALSSRATTFLGPIFVGWTTYLTGNPRLGMSVVLIFLALGMWAMRSLPDDGLGEVF